MEFITQLLMIAVLLLPVAGSRLERCVSREDCPGGAYCFKDECPRCICPRGQHVVRMFTNGRLVPLCEEKQRTTQTPLIGEPCDASDSYDRCPFKSVCASSGACACEEGHFPNSDRSYCRLALFGEACDSEHPCDGRHGFQCDVTVGLCGCSPAFRRPNEWAQFVLQRWNYSLVEEGEQQCVARAVGEPCHHDQECSAVGGSGAVCGRCGFCQCRHVNHVPDILGTKCGPGLGFEDQCSLDFRTAHVCDGSKGLQCGDVCDLYGTDDRHRSKKCRCSQMHDKRKGKCVPKRVGSSCSTDLDCYPISEGFGYCNSSKCAIQVTATNSNYQPDLVNKVCDLPPLPTTTPREASSLEVKDGQEVFKNTSGPGQPSLYLDVADMPGNESAVQVSGTNSRKETIHETDRSSSSSSGGGSICRKGSWTRACAVVFLTVLLRVFMSTN